MDTITGFVAHGKCAAKALLGNTLTPSSSVDSSIAAGKVGLVKEWKVPNGYLVGGIIEFTLSSSSPMSYKVRKVAAKSTTADLRSNQKLCHQLGLIRVVLGTFPISTALVLQVALLLYILSETAIKVSP